MASTVAAAPRLGALNLFAAVIFGQLVCAVSLDHFGVLYREHQRAPAEPRASCSWPPESRSCGSSATNRVTVTVTVTVYGF